jgi:PAS domain S-box-containing protein
MGTLSERPAARDTALERLQLALASAGLALWRWDAERGVRYADGLLQIAGITRRHLEADPDCIRRMVHPEDVAAVWRLDEAMLRGLPYDAEYRLVRPDGSVRWVAHHARPEPGPRPGPPALIGSIADITERKRAEERLRVAHDELEARVRERTDLLARANTTLANEVAERRAAESQVRELLGQLVDAEEEERRHMARELHDSLGQHLAALTLGLHALDRDAALPAALRERVGALLAATRRLEDDVDRLAHQLRPTALDDLGLDDALRELAQAWQQDAGVELEAHVRGLRGRRLPRELETTAYRIVQEALTNVRKHAGASRVGLIVETRGDMLRVIVEDDGRGFDAAAVAGAASAPGRRLGLRGMAERASLAGGQLEMETAPGQGTTLYLTLPLSKEDDA